MHPPERNPAAGTPEPGQALFARRPTSAFEDSALLVAPDALGRAAWLIAASGLGRSMTSYGDARRVATAHRDLPQFVGAATEIGFIFLDDDGREQPLLQGQVVRLEPFSMLFRHAGLDEEIPLATIAKRVSGEETLVY